MSGGPGNAGTTNVRFLVIVVRSLAVLVGPAAACLGDMALAQGLHGGHSGHASSGQLELMTGIDHGFSLAATALLAGLAPFAALVWLPASREVGDGHDAVGPFGVLAWVLL
jgi:hypothetical protein